MSSGPLLDQPARAAIRNELDVTMLVEAGAGSGKTHSLAERITSLIKTGRAEIDRIVAITFTRKAAGELKERVQDVLEKCLAEMPPGLERERLAAAYLDLERGFIGTIHSFCERILRERPVEAALDPEFETIEGQAEKALSDQVWQEYIRDIQTTDKGAIAAIEEMGLAIKDIREIYESLSLYPEVEFSCAAGSRLDTGRTSQALDEFLASVEPLMPSSPVEGRSDGLQDVIREVQNFRALSGLNKERQFYRIIQRLDRNIKVTQKLWPSREYALQAQAVFESFRERVVVPAMEEIRVYRYGELLPLVLPAVRRLGERRAALAKLNYQDLLLRTADALRDHPGMRRYLQERYTHLLVDEFQDTDPIQAEIMFYLTGQDTGEPDWRKLVPRPGSLFAVGDPKQSIYRFRRADMDTYNLVKQLILDNGGRCLCLETNFRSLPALADFINPVFQKILPEKDTDFQASYAPLHVRRQAAPGTLGGVRKITIPRVFRHSSTEIAQLDAERIAGWIRSALDSRLLLTRENGGVSPVRPSDILLLLHYKKELIFYARALEERGINYHISGGSGMQDISALKHTHTLLASLARPDDPVLLAGALRGAFFGFSDQELWEYSEAGGEFSIFARIPDDLPSELFEMFTSACGRLRTYYRWTGELPATAAISAILSDLGLLPWMLSVAEARSGGARLMQIRELLAGYEAAGETSFSELVGRFAEILETGADEELDLDAGDREVVRLMNLHRAKGLEAPIVFLAHPGKVLQRDPDLYIDRMGDQPRGYLQVCGKNPYGGAGPVIAGPPGWPDYQAREMQYQDAEEKRLLYVAATRAKDLLVVSAYQENPKKSPWFLLSSELNDVPELEEPAAGSAGAKEQSREQSAVTPSEYCAIATHLAEAQEAAQIPSFALQGVADLTQKSGYPLHKSEGRGMAWGRAVHSMLEKIAGGEQELNTRADVILATEGVPQTEKDNFLNLLRKILETGFWRRVEAADKRLSEVPLGALLELGTAGLPAITRGVIDLAFQESGGWVLVDFKSDYYENSVERELLAAYYAPQLRKYAEIWQLATGATPVELGFFLTHNQEYVVIT